LGTATVPARHTLETYPNPPPPILFVVLSFAMQRHFIFRETQTEKE